MPATALYPATAAEAAEALAGSGPVRIIGGGTKLGWGRPIDVAGELHTTAMNEVAEHAEGDFTAVLGAGVRLADAQERFAAAGQMLALDPPLGEEDRATVGGVVSCAESGPMRHRYGAPRDLIIGVTLALADGTVARAGGKVIKNVAGYDLSKLSAGAFGTLGVIAGVAVRLHPRPARTATARFAHDDPHVLRGVARELSHMPLEAEALDVHWEKGAGEILARFGGTTSEERARAAAGALVTVDVAPGRPVPAPRGEVVEDDDELWAHQRAGQRSDEGVVVRVAALQGGLPAVLGVAAGWGARRVVGRAGVGTCWMTLAPTTNAAEVEELRAALAPAPCVVTDAPAELRAALDPWDVPEGPELDLMRRVKERFDPAGACNPGLYAGGL
jgi:glycolate oxidase FAD binding subunit